MTLGWIAALIGALHVHHAPSHDSSAPFATVLRAAIDADLDFLVLTEHAESESGPLPAAEHAGFYPKPDGGDLLVLVGVELATADGHLLAYEVPELFPFRGRSGREVIEEIHARGGFAVAAHPLTHGGWRDWSAPLDGLEVHNSASSFRRITGPLLPLRLLRYAFDRRGGRASMLRRPDAELELWDGLLAQGRRLVAFSGADAHGLSLLGWTLDPYVDSFRSVQTRCPDGPLAPEAIWSALRSGRCWIHYAILETAGEAQEVVHASGWSEWVLPGGEYVLRIHSP